MGLLGTILFWCLSVVLCLLLGIAVDLYSRPKSRFHSTKSLLYTYFIDLFTTILAPFQWRRFQKDAHAFIQAQERFLLRQIRDNENTQYGRDHQFSRIHNLADFRRLHPVTSYSHYAPYIERAENGDMNAILGKAKLAMLACSSGTTGKPKHIPVSDNTMGMMVNILGALCGFHPEVKPVRAPLYKEMQILCRPRWRYTSTGLKIGPLSALFSSSPALMAQWATPFEAHLVDTEAEAVHVSLLFGLRDRDLIRIDGGFASGLFNMLLYIENNWRDLTADIRSGRLKEDLAVKEEHRRIINAHLVPDPERARELEIEFEKGFDGILPRIFPRLAAVSALSSGSSMALYKKKCLPYLGHMKPLSLVYGSSEAFFGVNMRSAEQEPAYVVIPAMCLVEFLPVDETGSPLEGQEPVLADQVEIGRLYEPVVTNCSGFYRFRQGDVIKVVDFYHQAPCIDFQFRAGQLLNVHMEKLSEESFYNALQAAVGRWPAVTLRDFTSAESVLDPHPRPGAPYYLVFLELETGDVTQQQINMIDEELCKQNYVYKSFRVKDSIAPMKVMLVNGNTFKAFRQFQFDTTTAFLTQFKQPRVLRTSKQVEFFLKHIKS